jgi:hypothetical protein
MGFSLFFVQLRIAAQRGDRSSGMPPPLLPRVPAGGEGGEANRCSILLAFQSGKAKLKTFRKGGQSVSDTECRWPASVGAFRRSASRLRAGTEQYVTDVW